ncbi:hypothetical protein BT63DRAFT_460805 [Microthyrium microscopicum]|uniref:Uncharacterized protein n=1 Tax=Microthyrium microscopicum TaxID=703497 RepID=A0A6A6TXW3_9PEZI|nr:hypothetical protein BT63DRAFT_460805 [Microthyrium microscopicum]
MSVSNSTASPPPHSYAKNMREHTSVLLDVAIRKARQRGNLNRQGHHLASCHSADRRQRIDSTKAASSPLTPKSPQYFLKGGVSPVDALRKQVEGMSVSKSKPNKAKENLPLATDSSASRLDMKRVSARPTSDEIVAGSKSTPCVLASRVLNKHGLRLDLKVAKDSNVPSSC